MTQNGRVADNYLMIDDDFDMEDLVCLKVDRKGKIIGQLYAVVHSALEQTAQNELMSTIITLERNMNYVDKGPRHGSIECDQRFDIQLEHALVSAIVKQVLVFQDHAGIHCHLASHKSKCREIKPIQEWIEAFSNY